MHIHDHKNSGTEEEKKGGTCKCSLQIKNWQVSNICILAAKQIRVSEIHINIKDNPSSIETEEEGILKTTSRTLQLLVKIA